MASIPRPEQNAIWFFTETGSAKDRNVQNTPQACLTYAHSRSKVFVSVSGTLTRVSDHDTITDLWNDDAQAFFPKGPDDPDVVLLRFDPVYGEYWDARSSPLATAIRFLTSRVSGVHRNPGSTGTAHLTQTPGAVA
jgi:general stress protein 26